MRHVEVQVLADKHGAVVHLGERECSIQRRSQKLVEESPSTAVGPALRERLGAAAVAIAHEAGYESAGTIEFLLDAEGNFYFIEANARLQVEHCVTEMVTEIDLVQEQLRLAAGERLGYAQADVAQRGWAIECRILAEDAENGFLPSLGRVAHLNEPSGPGVRVDSSLFAGLEVGPHYDSLLAKLVVWGRDRRQAASRLRRALAEYEVAGVKTTIPFHRQLLADEAFLAGDIDTHFVERRYAPADDGRGEGDSALIVAAVLSHERRRGSPSRGKGNGAAALPERDGWRRAARLAATDRAGGGPWRSTF